MKAVSYTLDLLKQLADGLAKQFGLDCEIMIHGLEKHDLRHSVAHINNEHMTNRRERGSPSKVVLETLRKNPTTLRGHLGYLTHIPNGKILKSSTFYICNKEGTSIDHLPSINHDITGLMTVDHSIKALIDTEPQVDVKQQLEQIAHNISDLLDTLIKQSTAPIGKLVALMNREEGVTTIQLLDDAGASLITKSGDKVSKYFGISKSILYSYTDVNSRRSNDENG